MNASVLILDGDHWQRESLAAALAYEGFRAETAGAIAGAMAMLARQRFHLVLLDPSAPATGGWESVERLVRVHPDLPVIVLVPEDEQSQPRSPAKNGAGAVIKKPIDFPALIQSVRSMTGATKELPAHGISDASFATGLTHIPCP